jgi:NAD+ dependent glucose-6-phosphate dehydrogenase
MERQRVLITGAAGRIGSFVRRAWDGRYDLVLTDRKPPSDPGGAEVVVGETEDVEAMRRACRGVDTVLHLAADANSNADFDASLLRNNIIGTHNVYRAAAE